MCIRDSFSGTATYRKTVKIPKENLREGIEVILDLGKVRDLAEVFVNGQSTTVLWHMPYICDITKNVKKGNNVIEIAVTNTWANCFIGDEMWIRNRNQIIFYMRKKGTINRLILLNFKCLLWLKS